MEHRILLYFLTTRPTCKAWIVVTSSFATTMQGDNQRSDGRGSSWNVRSSMEVTMGFPRTLIKYAVL